MEMKEHILPDAPAGIPARVQALRERGLFEWLPGQHGVWPFPAHGGKPARLFPFIVVQIDEREDVEFIGRAWVSLLEFPPDGAPKMKYTALAPAWPTFDDAASVGCLGELVRRHCVGVKAGSADGRADKLVALLEAVRLEGE